MNDIIKWPIEKIPEKKITKDDTLLPCPLCGSEAVIVNIDDVGCSRENCLFWYKWETVSKEVWQDISKYAQRNIIK